VLKSTFIHIQGIGPVVEQRLWRQNVITWQDYLARRHEITLGDHHLALLDAGIVDSIDALENSRVDYFAQALANKNHWRAALDFPKLGFLDIETDGGTGDDSITIIGLYDGIETHLYTQGINLAQFAYECQDYDGFVTFFGGGFDIPMLKRRFPVLTNVFADRIHIDLCPLLKTLGYRGGLKSIERQIGLLRRPETDGLTGMDAVRLWRVYQRGGESAEDALRLLHRYNEEDVVNLKALLEFALPKLRAKDSMPDPAADIDKTLTMAF
jgi:uncharacterized protein YprB with RNaseH-like and TPR domain